MTSKTPDTCREVLAVVRDSYGLRRAVCSFGGETWTDSCGLPVLVESWRELPVLADDMAAEKTSA